MHRINSALRVSSLLLITLGLTACGSTSSTSHSASGSSGHKASVAKARTVALGPFCDQLDPAAAATALGVPAMKLTVNLEPGQKFAPVPGDKKTATAASYECTLSTPAAGFKPDQRSAYLSTSLAGPPPAGTTFKKLADQQYAAAGQGARCSRRPVKGWGAMTDSWTCTVSQGYPQVVDSRRAQFGTTRFGCSVGLAGGKLAKVQTVSAAADRLCNDLLAKISD